MDHPQPTAAPPVPPASYAQIPPPYIPGQNAFLSGPAGSRLDPNGGATTDQGTRAVLAQAAAMFPPPDPYSLIAPSDTLAAGTASATAASSGMQVDSTQVDGMAPHSTVNPSGVYNPFVQSPQPQSQLRTDPASQQYHPSVRGNGTGYPNDGTDAGGQGVATPMRRPAAPLTPFTQSLRNKMHRAHFQVQSAMRATALQTQEVIVDYVNVRKRGRESAEVASSSFERQVGIA